MGETATKLFNDAQVMLKKLVNEKWLTAKAVIGFYPANSMQDDIEIYSNEERKSIEITMESVPERTDFWVRIPQEMLYAENENYVVLVDGVDTRYGVMKFPDDYVVSFVITETTKNIEIIGTKIVPEFGMFSIAVLGISILGMVYFIQRTKLKIYS